jgi:outer membrane protein assembly factor BamB
MKRHPITTEIRSPTPDCARAATVSRHRSSFCNSSSVIIGIWLAVAGGAAAAQTPKLAGESPRTAQRFGEAAELENQQRWDDAVHVYLRLLDDAGDDLVAAGGDPRHLLPARGFVHRKIAARPELLASYRTQVEPRARSLLERATAARDRQLLEQVVEQFFCSRSAETALHLLGDLACERGEFEAARRYWHSLGQDGSEGELTFPDPLGGPALARAKSILARLLAGERADAAAELLAFRKAHADAAGHLAGRDGNLATTLQSLLDTADTVRVPAPLAVAVSPTTFSGDASRNGVLSGMLPPFSPQPRFPPIPLPGTEEHQGAVAPIRPAALAYFPVIARGQVFVTDDRRVLAYDLATGRRSGRFEMAEPDGGQIIWADAKPPRAGGPFTLTVDGDRVYAAIGPPRARPGRDAAAGGSEPGHGTLVCLQWHPELPTPEERLQPRWKLPPPAPAAAWDGAPVIRDGRLYAAATQVEGARAVTSIACYAADAPAGPIWQRDVYETAAETVDRTRGHLLSLAGSTVALCSHAGVIVALDVAAGRRAWAFRYPSLAPGSSSAGPAPCVVAGGRLYAAPIDSDRVYCLDAATGSPLWTSDPVPVAHLLGVAQNRLVLTMGGFHAGLCALNAATGRRLGDWGYRVAGADAFAPLGRGLLCRDRVYWPTRAAGLQELRWDGTTGYVPTAFRNLLGGNLAYGDGCLVVATADHLHVLIGDAGEVAGPGNHVGELPPDQRHDLLLWRAELLRQSGRPGPEVLAALDAAAATEFSPGRRYFALVRLAEFERESGHEAAAFAIERSLSEAADVDRVALRDADGVIRFALRPADAPTGERRGVGPASYGPKLVGPSAGRSPQLRFPLEETWRLPLERGREWGLLPESDPHADRVYVAGRGWLARRNVYDGSETWRQDVGFAPTSLTVANASLIVAGDNGAARLDAADGRSVWQFRLPEPAPWFDRPGWRDPSAVAPSERLSGFRWAGGRLIARLGRRSILALDGATGALLWQRTAPLAGDFHAAYFADERSVVLQSADGQCRILDAATGHTLHTGPAPADPWPSPPLGLDPRRLLVVEEGRVMALDRLTWQPAWTWELPRPLNLTGELPQTRLVDGTLLVGVPRNDCYEIEQIDPTTGRPRFTGGDDSIAVGHERVDFDAVALDAEMLHVVADGECKSIGRRDGRIVARRKVDPIANWRVEPVSDGLLLWTTPAGSATMAPQPGRVLCIGFSGPEHRRVNESSLALGPGPGTALQCVRTVGNEVIVVSDMEVRGYRGANREVK